MSFTCETNEVEILKTQNQVKILEIIQMSQLDGSKHVSITQ